MCVYCSSKVRDFSKCPERDISSMMKGSQAYANIMHDNERYDFVKKFR